MTMLHKQGIMCVCLSYFIMLRPLCVVKENAAVVRVAGITRAKTMWLALMVLLRGS